MTAPDTTWGALILHPNRRPAAQQAVAGLTQRLAQDRPGYVVWILRSPMEPVVAHAQQAPAGAPFHLVPLLLAPGSHFAEDVAALAATIRNAVPGLEVRVRPPLLQDESFVGWLLGGL